MQVQSLGGQDPLEKETATPSSCLENPMDRGAWWAIVWGVTQSDKTEGTAHTQDGLRPGPWRRRQFRRSPGALAALRRGSPPRATVLNSLGPRQPCSVCRGWQWWGPAGAESSEEKHPF